MNCKPGDLAIIISDELPHNIGLICEVKSYAGRVLFLDGSQYVNAWDVVSVGRPLVHSDGCAPSLDGCVEDSCLRPISGLPDTEDLDTREPIKEFA